MIALVAGGGRRLWRGVVRVLREQDLYLDAATLRAVLSRMAAVRLVLNADDRADRRAVRRAGETGWYPDPDGPGVRWWDGRAWTAHHAPSTTRTPDDILRRRPE